MADDIQSLTLEQLRLIRADIANLRDDVGEVKNRMIAIEQHIQAISSALAHF